MLRRMLNVRMLIAVVVLAAILAGGWFWYRGSSLVKIKHVSVTGLGGPDVSQIRAALTRKALTMTTLNLSVSKLEQAVSGFPEVSSITASTRGSHAVTIAVVEKIPVATVSGSLVDGGGYLLRRDTAPHERLPVLEAAGGAAAATGADGRITGAGNLAVLKVLSAASYDFLAKVQSGKYTAVNGVVLQLREGPLLYFGPASNLAQKWEAVIAVLASSSSKGASYINVIDPQQPAAGSITSK